MNVSTLGAILMVMTLVGCAGREQRPIVTPAPQQQPTNRPVADQPSPSGDDVPAAWPSTSDDGGLDRPDPATGADPGAGPGSGGVGNGGAGNGGAGNGGAGNGGAGNGQGGQNGDQGADVTVTVNAGDLNRGQTTTPNGATDQPSEKVSFADGTNIDWTGASDKASGYRVDP